MQGFRAYKTHVHRLGEYQRRDLREVPSGWPARARLHRNPFAKDLATYTVAASHGVGASSRTRGGNRPARRCLLNRDDGPRPTNQHHVGFEERHDRHPVVVEVAT
jgi:hypothetical protein